MTLSSSGHSLAMQQGRVCNVLVMQCDHKQPLTSPRHTLSPPPWEPLRWCWCAPDRLHHPLHSTTPHPIPSGSSCLLSAPAKSRSPPRAPGTSAVRTEHSQTKRRPAHVAAHRQRAPSLASVNAANVSGMHTGLPSQAVHHATATHGVVRCSITRRPFQPNSPRLELLPRRVCAACRPAPRAQASAGCPPPRR